VSDAVFRSCFWLKSERDIVHRVVSWTLDVLLFLSNSGVGLFADQIMGFDDLKYAELLATPLTTVSQPYRDLARNAMRAMFDRLADPSLPPTQLLSKPQLVVRTSCGAVARH
jgi:LacI family transcriptional regulator